MSKGSSFIKGTCDDCLFEPEPLSCEHCMSCKVEIYNGENLYTGFVQGAQTKKADCKYSATFEDFILSLSGTAHID